MTRRSRSFAGRSLALLAAVSLLGTGGCVVSAVGGFAADTLSAAILNQDDPAIVNAGLPAYLLIIDGLVIERPDNAELLAAGAQLFALYGSRFANDEAHGAILTAKSRRYGERALCLDYPPSCNWSGLEYDLFIAELEQIDDERVEFLYAYSVSWLSHLDATSSDWSAVGELPWVQAAMERVHELDETYDNGGVHVYLGILYAMRPPALGGELEIAKAHFERAIELSNGTDLSAKVEYARRYGRMMFEQELHDRLLTEVLEAPAEAPGRTLFNVLAKRDAEELLASSADYF
ncbi:MAG: TRAP transporter TatT component family protein [Candidatus Rariloculaceae bacterium]